jgi:hypothetical protein
MSYQLKVLSGLDRGNFAIVIARGEVIFAEFERLFDEVIDATRTFSDCKVLMDFQDSTIRFMTGEIANFIEHFEFQRWPRGNKIALVSSPDMQQYWQIISLKEALVGRKVEAGAFCSGREAIDWLTGCRG